MKLVEETEPLPAKAGRFGKLLKQPKDTCDTLLLYHYFSPTLVLAKLHLSYKILVFNILFNHLLFLNLKRWGLPKGFALRRGI